jgi:NADH-quinone oxidoreductase subunit C
MMTTQTALSPEALEELVEQLLSGTELNFERDANDEVIVRLQPNDLVAACQRLKQDERLALDYLRCLSGVDYEENLEVVYHLYSTTTGNKLVIKVQLPSEGAEIDSVTSVWKGANWHEREAAEMFGIGFNGHPNLVPLLLDEDVDYYPLRKSHPLVDMRENPG